MITVERTMYKPMKKLLLASAALLFTIPVTAQEPEEPVLDENTVRCVNLRMVRRTEIVDDKNILFYMRGGDVYHNILPRACNGLERENRFSYKTSMNRLCNLDTITVMYNSPGMRQGNSCGLGYFHKISEEDAEAFKEQQDAAPEAKPLPLPEPGEVDDEADEETAGEPDPR